MSRPVIGVCAAVERVYWGPWEETVTMAPRSYATAIQRAGGMAILLPADERAQHEPDDFLDRVDALYVVGGSDVDPAAYGAKPHPATHGTWPERDAFEIALVRRALDREMPVLGSCRGMEVLNVACGGTLEQNLPDRLGSDRHRHTPGAYGNHQVRLEPGSLAARAAGTERLTVKSHHHQGVAEIGSGFTVSGWAEPDDVVEAIEAPGHGFALGVLWHPEEDSGSRIIGSLVETTRGRVAA